MNEEFIEPTEEEVNFFFNNPVFQKINKILEINNYPNLDGSKIEFCSRADIITVSWEEYSCSCCQPEKYSIDIYSSDLINPISEYEEKIKKIKEEEAKKAEQAKIKLEEWNRKKDLDLLNSLKKKYEQGG
jgi:hypothetical protein